MINYKKYKLSPLILTCCFAFFYCSVLFAQQNVEDEYGLFLSPDLCLLSSKENTCEITVHIRWLTPARENYCLYQSPDQAAIKCWQDSDRGNHQLDFSLDENVTLYLLAQNSQAIIYSQTVRLQKEARVYRRSRRNPWRFY